MKKISSAILCLCMLTGLTACGFATGGTSTASSVQVEGSGESSTASQGESVVSSENTPALSSAPRDSGKEDKKGKSLVVYFSMPETTNPDNMTAEEDNSTVVVNGEVLGNTQYVAYVIEEKTGADIFRIEPQEPYPTDHETLVDLAKQEQNSAARPKLAANVQNLDEYDTVFIGYPNWWGDMPMILYTFFDEHDFSGKTIIPFNTHGGSGFSNTVGAIAELEPDAAVSQDGFTVSRSNVAEAEGDITAWLSELGY